MTEEEVAEAVRRCIASLPRGTITEICCATVLTQPEISRFVHQTRPLPATKLLALLGWLADTEHDWRIYRA